MISQVIELLQSENWYGVSETVEIAKGKNQFMFKFSRLFKQIRRWLSKSHTQ